MTHPVDPAVVSLSFEAIQPARLETALAAMDEIETQRQQLAEHWQKRLERARYEPELARRRYERVDPDNRLVAAELERRWEGKLLAWRQLEEEWQKAQGQELAPLSEADKATVRRLAEDVPALWYAATTTVQERKRLLRCLIQDVTLDAFSRPGFSLIHVRWHTGTITTVEVERPGSGRRKAVAVIERVRELAQHHPDDQIADILNAEGVTNALGQEWNLGRVRSVRYKNHIVTACPYLTSRPGPRGDGLVSAREAAEALEVSPFQIAEWFRFGWLIGHQREVGSPLWIRVTEDDLRRWTGAEPWGPDMVPVGEAPALLGMSQEQVAAKARAGRLLTYRVRIKKRWRWYVRVPAAQAIP